MTVAFSFSCAKLLDFFKNADVEEVLSIIVCRGKGETERHL